VVGQTNQRIIISFPITFKPLANWQEAFLLSNSSDFCQSIEQHADIERTCRAYSIVMNADMSTHTKESITSLLTEVFDPEIPALNIVDMGILRDVEITPERVIVRITPTYSGCPAMKTIEEDIHEILTEFNVGSFEVQTILSPAWTTDWLTENGRQKLLESGIAPPAETTANKRALTGGELSVSCPHCKSGNTKMISQFGSTACKALWKCNDCGEPFDYFKCI
jgi:ring-1,2-phenylacetyl-CoA epoxidase subunit PaaD